LSLAVLRSRALAGMEAPAVSVEVHLANGLPSFTIVGLPEAEVKESKDRVRSALLNCRFDFPARRITVNLAPADLPKESGRFDLPIALGILAASAQIPADRLGEYEFAGELALTGELRPIRGALTMTYNAHRSGRAFVLPVESATEASLVRDARVYPAATLLQVCAHLAGRAPLQLRVELRGVPKGDLAPKTVLEKPVQPGGWFSHWISLPVTGEDYKNLGQVTAWRATLWDGDRLLSEQKSFLW